MGQFQGSHKTSTNDWCSHIEKIIILIHLIIPQHPQDQTMYIGGVLMMGLLSTSLALNCTTCASLDYSKTNLDAAQIIPLPGKLDGLGMH